MLESFFIVFRESVELLLIVSAVLGYLKRAQRPDLTRLVFFGLAAGSGIALAIMVGLVESSDNGYWEAGLAIVLGLVVVFASAAALSSKVSIDAHVHDVLEDYLQMRSGIVLIAAFCAFAAFRETLETAIFLHSMVTDDGLTPVASGAALGLVLSACVGRALRSLGRGFSLPMVFRITTLLLLLMAIQFILEGVGKLLLVQMHQHDLAQTPLLQTLRVLAPGGPGYTYACAALMAIPLSVVIRGWWRETQAPAV